MPATMGSVSPADLFGPDGALAEVLPGYESRQCQTQMADFVAAAIESDQHALIEAGTGTGKSLAYLVPVLLAGRQTVISTATKALQDQLWEHDLPLAQRALGTSAPVALLKGRANYLCLLSLDEQTQQPELTVAPQLDEIRRWARATGSGDLDELGELATADARRALARGADTCEGRLCPFHDDCWAERARSRATEAQIVVTNHHLVFADAKLRQAGSDAATGMPLPAAGLAILDEAHTLEDAATAAFAAEIDRSRAARILNSARVRSGLARTHGQTISAALEASEAAFATLEAVAGASRAPIVDEIPAGARLARLAAELTDASTAVADRDERAWLERRLRELAMDAELIFRPGDPDWVHFVERDARRDLVAKAVPVAVDGLFARQIAATRTVVGTSATLAIDGSFDYVKSRIGLHGAADLITDAAFDYARQTRLYVASNLPPPPRGGESSDTYDSAIARAIRELTDVSGGRAFCLFTSHRALNATWRLVHDQLAGPALRQGEAPTTTLLDRFRRAGDAVLFGTRSFWEGVDIPGDALSLVVITRLPFAVPDDPVVAARTERLRAEGRDWFGEYALPRATLLLKQGFGRLIRSRRDRGVVAILDSRVATRAYGETVLASLPAAPRTDRLEDLAAFFAQSGE